MISTGIAALDARLGTLLAGRHYIVSGPPGGGKTTAALHFLGAGLEEGETCALLTQEDPGDLLSHGQYIGYDFRRWVDQDRLVFLQYRMDFMRVYSRVLDAERVFTEIEEFLGEEPPKRLVIDSVLPFLQGGHVANDLIHALADFLDRYPGTVYLTLPGDISDPQYRRLYDLVSATAAGVFHLDRPDGRAREFTIRKLRQQAVNAEPFRFSILPESGITESVPEWHPDTLSPEARRRIVAIDPDGVLEAGVLPTVRQSYEVTVHRSLEEGFTDLAEARYAALVIAIDPYAPERAFNLAYSLRKAGNGAPILFMSTSQGLRSSTRSRALRLGADDFLMVDNPKAEILERIAAATGRGHRRASLTGTSVFRTLQARDEDGNLRLMTENEFKDVIGRLLDLATPPFFAVITLQPEGLTDGGQTWRALRSHVRIDDGDLVARLGDGRLAIYLAHVDPELASELAKRLGGAHPGLRNEGDLELFRFPTERDALVAWVAGLHRLGRTEYEREPLLEAAGA